MDARALTRLTIVAILGSLAMGVPCILIGRLVARMHWHDAWYFPIAAIWLVPACHGYGKLIQRMSAARGQPDERNDDPR